jgi:hypothetical protein
MPLIDTSPQIDQLLEVAGLTKKKDQNLESKLKSSRLDTESLLDGVADVISNGDSDGVRLQAIKIGLQLNPETRQAMNDEQSKQAPTFNIFIKDPQSSQINRILLPRVNPNKVVTIDAVAVQEAES